MLKFGGKQFHALLWFTLMIVYTGCAHIQSKNPQTSQTAVFQKENAVSIEEILHDFDELMTAAEDTYIKQRWEIVGPLLKDGQIPVIINNQNEPSFYNSALFNRGEEPSLIVNGWLLSVYNEYPATVGSILFHQIQFIYDYVVSSTAENSNELSHYFSEVDAIYIQALFLRACLAQGIPIKSEYGLFVIGSFSRDDLQQLSREFYGIDKDMAYQFYSQGSGVIRGELLIEDFLDALYLSGQTLVQHYESYVSPSGVSELMDEDYLSILISIHTFNRFASSWVTGVFRSQDEFDENRERIQDINGIISKTSAIVSNQLPLLQDYTNGSYTAYDYQ